MMDWILLVASFVVAAIIVIIAYYLLKLTLKFAVALILNTIAGLVILGLINVFFNMGIPYDFPTLLICAICGIPGVACILILALLGTFI